MVLHLPVRQNIRAHTVLSSKWFGVSEFGRRYLETARLWIERAGQKHLLSRENQTSFDLYLVEAVRTYLVDGVQVRQRFFVPNRLAGVVMSLECDRPARFTIESHFDMRYYQVFNTDLSNYRAHILDEHGQILEITNEIDGPQSGSMKFCSVIRVVEGVTSIDLLPESQRLIHQTYLKDERREKLIQRAYQETHEASPDEAPIWDSYSNTVFAPARIVVEAPATIVYSFDERRERAHELSGTIANHFSDLFKQAEQSATSFLESSRLSTGQLEVDLAYNQVMTRFNTALVARNVDVSTEGSGSVKHFTAIFAGNKYFLDAWKRDENISLEALILANDFETVRTILDNTWQHQDERTGRLPQIVSLSEPVVFFSSDGTPWAAHRLWQYTVMSGDWTLLDEKYPLLERFFAASLTFVRHGLLPSGGIVKRSYLWETWEDTAFTPRDGYPVEIELLWLTLLEVYIPVFRDRNPALAAKLSEAREEGMQTFQRFYLDGYLADSLDYDCKPRHLLTPNGYIAFGLRFALPDDLSRQMVVTARHELAGHAGVRSLAPRDWPKVFSHEFLADKSKIHDGNMTSVGIYNYHRGIEWLWLNQFMVAGELHCGNADQAYRHYVHDQVRSTLGESGVGGLDELCDMHAPLGADFQAWSMASFSAALHRFAGVTVNALEKTVTVDPQIPSRWPHLRTSNRVERCRFDVEVRRIEDGGHLVAIHTTDTFPTGYTIAVKRRDNERDRVTVDDRDVSAQSVRLSGESDDGTWVGLVTTGSLRAYRDVPSIGGHTGHGT